MEPTAPNPMPFAWIQPYQTGSDFALAVWNYQSGYYDLGDGDTYTPQRLAEVWHPKWMTWPEVEKAIAHGIKGNAELIGACQSVIADVWKEDPLRTSILVNLVGAVQKATQP